MMTAMTMNGHSKCRPVVGALWAQPERTGGEREREGENEHHVFEEEPLKGLE